MHLKITGDFTPYAPGSHGNKLHGNKLDPDIGLFKIELDNEVFRFRYSFNSGKIHYNEVLELSPDFPHFGKYAHLISDEEIRGGTQIGEVSAAQLALAMDGHDFLQHFVKIYLESSAIGELDSIFDFYMKSPSYSPPKGQDSDIVTNLLNRLKSGVDITEIKFESLCRDSRRETYIAIYEEDLLIAERCNSDDYLHIRDLTTSGNFLCYGLLITSVFAPLLNYPNRTGPSPSPMTNLSLTSSAKASHLIQRLYGFKASLSDSAEALESFNNYGYYPDINIKRMHRSRAQILDIYNKL